MLQPIKYYILLEKMRLLGANIKLLGFFLFLEGEGCSVDSVEA